MAYSKLLFMSYAVPTFYPAQAGAVAAASGAPTLALSDPDLQARAQRFLNVLYWSANQFANKQGMTDSSTLKLFMAPEFYFRKATPQEAASQQFALQTFYGSYPESSRYELAEALYGAIHGQPQFADWTVVSGTICSALPLSPSPTRMDLLNTAIMMRGNRAQMDSSVPYILMEKHYISHIDGPPQAWHANLNPTSVFSFNLNPDQSLDNVIQWDGMTNGLEVCLDHSRAVLVDALVRLGVVLGPSVPRFDLQTVTSCGMDIVLPSVAVKNGGLVPLTDGMSHSVSGYPTPQTRLSRYQNYALNDIQQPALVQLPGGANYNVAYPNYTGQQGVYAYDALPLIQN